MADVVVDETEWVRAIVADSAPQRDLDPAQLIRCIQQAHRWILTPEIKAKYYSQYKRRVRTGNAIAIEMIKSFTGVMYDSTRTIEPDDNPPPIDGEYDRKDRHIVSAAAWVRGSVLITSDRRLTNQLRKANLPDTRGFGLLTTAEALAQLCP